MGGWAHILCWGSSCRVSLVLPSRAGRPPWQGRVQEETIHESHGDTRILSQARYAGHQLGFRDKHWTRGSSLRTPRSR